MASMVQTELEARALLREYGLANAGWTFRWDNARSRGGACHHRTKHISMSRHLVPLWDAKQVTDVLVHEVAHAVVGAGEGHGPVWKRQMRAMGAVPERTHSNATVQGRYLAICDYCGGKEIASAHRFTAVMRQGRHLHNVCKKPVRWVDTQGARV